MTVIGIDPGLDGGLAALDERGKIVGLEIMPVRQTSRGREVDGAALAAWLRDWDEPRVVLEVVGSRPHDGHQAAFKFGSTFGVVRGVVAALGLPLVLVRPQVWQAATIGRQSGDTKLRAVAYCRDYWPAVNLTPGKRTKSHSGLADALAIAEFGRRQLVGREVSRAP